MKADGIGLGRHREPGARAAGAVDSDAAEGAPAHACRAVDGYRSGAAGRAHAQGRAEAGNDADFVVFDPGETWTVTADDLHFRHKLSPYLGAELTGRVMETWLRGECVYRNGAFQGEARGRELVRA